MANFEDLNKEELLAVAEMFAVDARSSMTKPAIIKEIEDMGVDYATYQALLAKDAEVGVPEELVILQEEPVVEVVAVVEKPVAPQPDYHVVKMTRANVRYDLCGYTFTREHPYVLVKADDVDVILEQEGFRMATPKELREYYGQ